MPSSNKNLIRLLSREWESMAVDGSRDENCNQSCGASGAIPCLVGDPDAPGRATRHLGNAPYGGTGIMLNWYGPWPLSGTWENPSHAPAHPLAPPGLHRRTGSGPSARANPPGRLSPGRPPWL